MGFAAGITDAGRKVKSAGRDASGTQRYKVNDGGLWALAVKLGNLQYCRRQSKTPAGSLRYGDFGFHCFRKSVMSLGPIFTADSNSPFFWLVSSLPLSSRTARAGTPWVRTV